jgi:hypothetical protein
MESFSSLIITLGGPTEVAAALKMNLGTVQKMKDRDSIRPKHWPAFVKLARKRGLGGVSLETLARLSVRQDA